MDEHGATYEKLDADYDKKSDRIKELHSKLQAYNRYADYLEVYKKSKSLKGFAKLKFDRENKAMLEVYRQSLNDSER